MSASAPFIGDIQPFGFNFAPRGWQTCSGQLLPIAQNTALFSLLGCTFGGDCRTSFALPDLRGREMRGVGAGPGLYHISWGERGGWYETNLMQPNMPTHTHTATLHAETKVGSANNPQDKLLGITTDNIYTTPDIANNKTMYSESIAIGNTGSSLGFDIRSPFLGIYICISLTGIFPSRS
ncbi:Uncharacterised protein [BD1-7 clade bacterium]|nr:Uncharacterised protein [BD1-7 clade bacterium]